MPNTLITKDGLKEGGLGIANPEVEVKAVGDPFIDLRPA